MGALKLMKIEALILKRSPLGEHDRLVTVLSRDQGKKRVVARGAGKMVSKLSGLIQPYDRVQLDLWRGRTLDGIRGGEVLESFRGLRDDFKRIIYAACMAEVGEQLAQEENPDEPLYLLLLTCFRGLLRLKKMDLVLLFFIIRAMKVAGFLPAFETCSRCGAHFRGDVQFDLASGQVICLECSEGRGRMGLESASRVLLQSLRGVHPRELNTISCDPQRCRQLRETMLDFAEYHLSRPVKSRRFLDILD